MVRNMRFIGSRKAKKNRKTFLLGVGCPKGGTSWLHDYLSAQTYSDFGFDKEYHVFDRIFVPDCRRDMELMVTKATKLLESSEFLSVAYPNLLTRLNFYRNTDKYFEYFHYLALKNESTTLVGDITPSYCALPVEALQLIRSKLVEHGLSVKVIFIMRDPVERIWSALRMTRRKGAKLRNAGEESQQLQMYCKREDVVLRSQYNVTIKNLKMVFDSDEIHYQLYEDLFNKSSIKTITEFLGVPYNSPHFGKLVNSSPKTTDIAATDRALIVSHYQDSYQAAESIFGSRQLAEHWPSFKDYR